MAMHTKWNCAQGTLAAAFVLALSLSGGAFAAEGGGSNYLQGTYGDFGAAVTGRYIDSVVETSGAQPGNKLGSRTYVDLQLEYSPSMILNKRLTFTAGVNNLFDKDPPGCFSCSGNNYDPTTYDAPGQYGYARISYKM